MRSRIRNWVYTGMVLAMLAGSQTGCKSGWKMPGTDMFSWGRKPSESTLVGSGPTISAPGSMTASTTPKSANPPPSAPTGSPMSPALRSTPNQVASTAVNPGATTRPNGTNFGGYGPTPSAPYATTASAPVPGAAASANGYTTGAYPTGQPRPPMGVNTAPYGQLASNPASGMQPAGPSLATPQMPNGQGMPNAQGMPFAQGPASSPAGAPNYSYPSRSPVASSSPQVYGGMTVPRGPSTIASAPSGALPPAAVPSGYSMTPPSASNGLPVAGLPAAGLPNATIPGARTASAQGLPAVPVSSGSNLPPGLPPNTQMPVAYGGSAPSSMPVMSTPTGSSSGNAPYLPGSVGRNTPYDFSNQGPGVAPSSPASSYPRTATDPYAIPNR